MAGDPRKVFLGGAALLALLGAMALLSTSVVLPSARAAGEGDAKGAEKPAAPAAPKGEKSLPEVMQRMKYYNQALGVECDYCHVPNKFEIETPRKKTAKWMQEHMVDALVTKAGSSPIDCRTCHEGRARFLPSSQ